jgi:hypothetical protein
MMQTDSASADEDIGDRKEKEHTTTRTGGTGRGSLPPFGTLDTRSTTPWPDARRLSFGRGCSAHDDGGAPSSSLAHGMSGPLGSHCTTATCATRSAIQSSSKSFHSSREAAAPRSVPDPIIRGGAARRVVTSSRVQQRIARKRSPRTGAHQPSAQQHPCGLDALCTWMTCLWSADRHPQPLAGCGLRS